MSIVILLFLIFYLILAIIRLEWALMLIILSLPLYVVRFDFFLPTTLLELMILVCFAVWFFRNYKAIYQNIKNRISLDLNRKAKIRHLKLVRYPFDVEIALLLIVSFVAAAVAGFSNSALGIWKAYFFEPILVFILIFNVFKPAPNPSPSNSAGKQEGNGWRFGSVLRPLLLSAFFVSLLAVYQKITGNFLPPDWADKEPLRVTSIFPYPNAVGLCLGPLVLLFIGWLVNKITNNQKSITKKISNSNFELNSKYISSIVFIIFTIFLSLSAIIYAWSRGALFGAAIGLIVFAWLADKKARWAAIIIIIIFSVGILSFAPAREKAIRAVSLSDLSGEIRKQQWRETWQMMTDSPKTFILGAGLSNYQKAIKPYHQEGIFFNRDNDPDFRRKIVIFDDKYRAEKWQPVEIYLYPHNILLNFWTELGLAGALLFVWIFIKYFRMGIYNHKILILNKALGFKFLNISLICSMVALTVHGLVDAPYFKNDLAVMFWLLIALMSFINMELRGLGGNKPNLIKKI